jgi:dihydropteroate synthase type 2
MMVSVSRKSFLAATVGVSAEELGPGSLAAELYAMAGGVDYVRTHSPAALRDAALVWAALGGHRLDQSESGEAEC